MITNHHHHQPPLQSSSPTTTTDIIITTTINIITHPPPASSSHLPFWFRDSLLLSAKRSSGSLLHLLVDVGLEVLVRSATLVLLHLTDNSAQWESGSSCCSGELQAQRLSNDLHPNRILPQSYGNLLVHGRRGWVFFPRCCFVFVSVLFWQEIRNQEHSVHRRMDY